MIQIDPARYSSDLLRKFVDLFEESALHLASGVPDGHQEPLERAASADQSRADEIRKVLKTRDAEELARVASLRGVSVFPRPVGGFDLKWGQGLSSSCYAAGVRDAIHQIRVNVPTKWLAPQHGSDPTPERLADYEALDRRGAAND